VKIHTSTLDRYSRLRRGRHDNCVRATVCKILRAARKILQTVARTQLRNSTRVIFPFELHVSNWTVLLNIRSTYALSAQQFAISRSTQIKIFRNFCYCLTFAQNMESLFICFIYFIYFEYVDYFTVHACFRAILEYANTL